MLIRNGELFSIFCFFPSFFPFALSFSSFIVHDDFKRDVLSMDRGTEDNL